MIITRDYLLKKPAGPSGSKLFLDTKVVPMAVNVAGGLEVALDRAAARTGVRPAVLMAGVTALVSLIAWRLVQRETRAPSARQS